MLNDMIRHGQKWGGTEAGEGCAVAGESSSSRRRGELELEEN